MAKRRQAQPAPAKGRKTAEPRKRRTGLRRFVWRWIGRVVLLTVGVPVLWVAAYRVIDPPGGYYMLTEWWRLGSLERDWRDIDAVSPDLVRAVIAAEDANFCSHWGFDVEAIRKALESNEDGKRLVGGSTISQQVAKNVFLWHERSWLRKGLEAGFTLLIEAFWPKRRIVEVYLNTVEFDTGVFGAEAAARHYFGTDAAGLSLTQAARLAAILPAPRNRSASEPSDYVRRRARSIAGGAATLAADGRAECAVKG